MAATESKMIALGSTLPAFELTDAVTGKMVKSSDFVGKPLVVAFICNHCPFVVHIREELVKVLAEAHSIGVAAVAINSNSIKTHPQDGPTAMRELATSERWSFPFLFDSTQSVAKSFDAACTPDLYLFDARHLLVYRGQFDDSRPRNGKPVTGKDLRAAIVLTAAGKVIEGAQLPSIGCNIKWEPEASAA